MLSVVSKMDPKDEHEKEMDTDGHQQEGMNGKRGNQSKQLNPSAVLIAILCIQYSNPVNVKCGRSVPNPCYLVISKILYPCVVLIIKLCVSNHNPGNVNCSRSVSNLCYMIISKILYPSVVLIISLCITNSNPVNVNGCPSISSPCYLSFSNVGVKWSNSFNRYGE
jgi:hypothetical protein